MAAPGRWNQVPRRFVGTPTSVTRALRQQARAPFSQIAISRGDAVNKIRALDTRRKVAPPLDTPTHLSEAAVSELDAQLNEILADAFPLYLKTQNFHWHGAGPHLRQSSPL